jgi:hypothetical protein
VRLPNETFAHYSVARLDANLGSQKPGFFEKPGFFSPENF